MKGTRRKKEKVVQEKILQSNHSVVYKFNMKKTIRLINNQTVEQPVLASLHKITDEKASFGEGGRDERTVRLGDGGGSQRTPPQRVWKEYGQMGRNNNYVLAKSTMKTTYFRQRNTRF